MLGPAQLLLPGGKSLVPGAKAAALGCQPGIVPSLHSRGPLSQLMFALGGPNTQQSALNFSLFCCELQVSNAIAGFKGKLTGEHKSTNLHFIHKQ